ncbi:hypothetical protein JL108_14445 [Aeromicrobium sp. YIM 150415]|uniref:hypothetical protein n=1 Tax=Aeromicrobium sp. YIM 150415 TaxID=2803912 RepID=UPI001965941F|nr:hypothetical protein [Aeromicrobium sp. YIM 150415]MBM9464653.1 hypothetical protein [Aeromicrobium sp. YIM 150415]
MCVSENSADAEEMQQFVPGSTVAARTVTEGEWGPVDQGSEPDGPDLSLIPSSREEARPVEVNGGTGHLLE